MEEIRVLIIIDSLGRGGRERRLIELLKGFDERSFIKVSLVVLKNIIKYPEIYSLTNTELTIFERRIKKDPTVFYKLYNLTRVFKPDIIHSWGSMPSIYTVLTARLQNIRFINAMISDSICPKMSSTWWRKKLTFPFSDVIVSNSHAGIKAYNVVPKKARVIKNGFDMKRIENLVDPEKIRKRFNVKTKYVVGMVATFSDNKDYDTIIKAAEKILMYRQDITFMLVGGGPNLSHYKKLIRNDFNSFILFPGNQQKIESVINIFDIGVLTTFTEGISNSIMEYMALSKPVIATEGGGTSEIVVNNQTGFIIDHASVDQLIDRIEFLIDNPQKASEMGLKGKERIVKHFSIKRMVNQTIDLYREVLDRKD